MNIRLPYLRRLRVFLCVFAQISLSTIFIAAAEPAAIVKMDNKTIFIPEVKLTQKVNPVSSFLYVGSWTKGTNDKKSSCSVDSKNNQIRVHSPDKLLEGSKPRVVTQNNVEPFLDRISWGKQQTTQIAFQVISKKHQPVLLEAYADSDVDVFLNGKRIGHVNANKILAADGIAYVPMTLTSGQNIISVKQSSIGGAPHLELAVRMDHSHDLGPVKK